MIIKPKVRGFVCITAHPEGCAANVREQIEVVKKGGEIKNGPKNILVLGASTGYGLASRITGAFGCGAKTLGVFFERPGTDSKPASAGWYNTAAFQKEAEKAGLGSWNINGDAFSDEIKDQAVSMIKEHMGKIDLIVYSLAAPRRTDPETGIMYKSCLKPIGAPYSAKTVNTDKDQVGEVSVEPANEEEIEGTRKVMGGEDWERWINRLDSEGLLAEGSTSVAYDYLGPDVTWPIYKEGSIGMAKQHLKETAERINSTLKLHRGVAFCSVNKALVTQASSAIPVIPLYISILYKLMKEKGNHEGCIEQIDRLFRTQMYNDSCLDFDDEGLVRMDDYEMQDDIQTAIKELWPKVTTENLYELTDYQGYKDEFLKLFGFGIDGVDYEADVATDVEF
jgi:enoyl-[acyl-carrier protein] reductase/trans-2-enoyl-CoA reductase (NAD+)